MDWLFSLTLFLTLGVTLALASFPPEPPLLPSPASASSRLTRALFIPLGLLHSVYTALSLSLSLAHTLVPSHTSPQRRISSRLLGLLRGFYLFFYLFLFFNPSLPLSVCEDVYLTAGLLS